MPTSPHRRRSSSVPVIAGLGIAGLTLLGGCAPGEPELPACIARTAVDAVPAEGALFGVNPDWGDQTLAAYAELLGRDPAVAVSFADVPLDATDRENVLAAGEQVRGMGGTLLLTLEPREGLAEVTDEVAGNVAGLVDGIQRTGVPVVVRFAHEMNGSWYAWGQQPEEYVAAFRRVADALHTRAPGSAVMWAPNEGGGYPFTGGPSAAVAGTEAFELLDTDGDGVLTIADDPYAPYYPGDDAVDWVGMSLYHWGSEHPWGENVLPEEGKFAAQLTGEYAGLDGDQTAVPDFYGVYGIEHGKPVAIPETAALVVPRGDDAGERAIKQAWWAQVLSDDTAARFPELKMVNWFEWDKEEAEVGESVDWTVLGDPATRAAFAEELPAWLRFGAAPEPCAVLTGAPPSAGG
ncbi:glycoside hydrolase family 26 protein [Clavibacter michiganensis]|uniref:Endoglucanase H n=1 Tax=Clavibacter michiganensis TaxID=28447 RepID=A0A251YJ24_9MICO|nr:glycosyl hydrolase [Clavibacter michiganensis]OUE24235.1 Endoglucanase H precursor [Clavibacter michiganensis]